MSLRTLIVDDEAPARSLLREYCEDFPEIEVLGESRDGLEALEHIRSLQPELVFLDVKMPGLDGFAVLNALSTKELPGRVVFTTAYDQFALQAFEVAATDYLLKPFDKERFAKTIRRALSEAQVPGNEIGGGSEAGVLLVRSGSSARAVQPQDVLWIEAAGDYAKVHTRQGEFLATSGLGALEGQLDRTQFMRVHRSVLLYLPALRRLSPRSSGGWLAELEGGTKVPVGRKYVEMVKARFL